MVQNIKPDAATRAAQLLLDYCPPDQAPQLKQVFRTSGIPIESVTQLSQELKDALKPLDEEKAALQKGAAYIETFDCVTIEYVLYWDCDPFPMVYITDVKLKIKPRGLQKGLTYLCLDGIERGSIAELIDFINTRPSYKAFEKRIKKVIDSANKLEQKFPEFDVNAYLYR